MRGHLRFCKKKLLIIVDRTRERRHPGQGKSGRKMSKKGSGGRFIGSKRSFCNVLLLFFSFLINNVLKVIYIYIYYIYSY